MGYGSVEERFGMYGETGLRCGGAKVSEKRVGRHENSAQKLQKVSPKGHCFWRELKSFGLRGLAWVSIWV